MAEQDYIPDTIESAFEAEAVAGLQEIWLAGGCFWGTEEYLSRLPGVLRTSVGYANGHLEQPTYEEVCTLDTGFAETVQVLYDARVVPLGFLLEQFFKSIDPTAVNRQGNDVGSQYRSGIYYRNPQDLPVIEAALAELAEHYKKPLAVEVKPLRNYFLAEEYHQKYLQKNPTGYCHIPRPLFQEAQQARAYEKLDDAELRRRLTPLQYGVTQESGTEPPFDNPFWQHDAPGVYLDITTGEPLFLSADKFACDCGWPAFARPLAEGLLEELPDHSHGMTRTEVRSRNSGAHLGHLFPDGPPQLGGLRYCINSAALRFLPREEMAAAGLAYLLPRLEAEA